MTASHLCAIVCKAGIPSLNVIYPISSRKSDRREELRKQLIVNRKFAYKLMIYTFKALRRNR